MSAAELLSECGQLGIRLEAQDDRLRYHPRSAAKPALIERLKTHKGELLALLRAETETPNIDLANATAVWRAALDSLATDPDLQGETLAGLRCATVRWETATDDGKS